MNLNELRITYVGRPTALLELGGLQLLTDPTFDPPGGEYTTGPVTLRKLAAPAMSPDALGRLDAILLSHDHHFDNLDHAGRALLGNVDRVLTTQDGALRLGRNVIGLAAWQSVDLQAANSALRVTGTPARHGPADGDRGPVIGFVLALVDRPDRGVYISGDTVWFEGVAVVPG
jgi:L-ascorbate metabolism protein UlaG (beta-lactamase superfamily)